ncbi:MAG: hypothetical protein FGM15_03440 [Chthoniobacterales bacterium]|nr:hypothetical protein [Chthoniobacterales bacterium]
MRPKADALRGVIIPSYNSGHLLAETLRGTLASGFPVIISDERLVGLLNEPCDMSEYNFGDDIAQSLSIVAPGGDLFGSDDDSWLAGTDICNFTLLTRLALAGKRQAFEVVRQNFREPSLRLPYSDVFLVHYVEYSLAEEPWRVREQVLSGAAATESAAAWPFDDDGYIEPLAGNTSFDDIRYSLDALSFGFLSMSAKFVEGKVKVELACEHFLGEGLKGQSLADHLLDASDCYACSATTFGSHKKDLSVVTLVFTADLT